MKKVATAAERHALLKKLGLCINGPVPPQYLKGPQSGQHRRTIKIPHGPPVAPSGKCQHCIDVHTGAKPSSRATKRAKFRAVVPMTAVVAESAAILRDEAREWAAGETMLQMQGSQLAQFFFDLAGDLAAITDYAVARHVDVMDETSRRVVEIAYGVGGVR